MTSKSCTYTQSREKKALHKMNKALFVCLLIIICTIMNVSRHYKCIKKSFKMLEKKLACCVYKREERTSHVRLYKTNKISAMAFTCFYGRKVSLQLNHAQHLFKINSINYRNCNKIKKVSQATCYNFEVIQGNRTRFKLYTDCTSKTETLY